MAQPLTGEDLLSIGYKQSPAIGMALEIMEKHFRGSNREKQLQLLVSVLERPAAWVHDKYMGRIAAKLLMEQEAAGRRKILRPSPIPVSIYGSEYIEPSAIAQMNLAARLPVSVAAALMPDAHHGYGLPIGGVLATENAVVPYGVGVDIGCRMCLSVFDLEPGILDRERMHFKAVLDSSTLFGAGAEFRKPHDHAVLYDPLFSEMGILRGLQKKAAHQLGSSGSGNHFVEFGVIEIPDRVPLAGIKPGKYLGLLSHSGSRALGATIANHFTRVAMEKCVLDPEAKHLAWLSLGDEEGAGYWEAMNLAGEYASACHHIIHEKIAAKLALRPLTRIENHHNFAWKELHREKEWIVHRKGATPAGRGVLGIIPGSMTTPAYIISGKGEEASLHSASHGAGRRMSRTTAIATISPGQMNDDLEKNGITLMGGGTDESSAAYKDIREVMDAQQALVEIAGTFMPRIVKMDSASPKTWRKKSLQP